MQKYNVEALYKSANKILGNHIKEIQNKIDRFMSTQSKDVNAVIFRDYMTNGQEWYNGYTMYEYDSKIGLYVYFYNAYDAYDDYSRVINKIVSIINASKLPIPFTVNCEGDEQIPIEIVIKISDIEKLFPDTDFLLKNIKKGFSYQDAAKVISKIIDKNKNSIKQELQFILNTYGLGRTECVIAYDFRDARYFRDIVYAHEIIVHIFQKNPKVKLDPSLLAEIRQLMSKYIDFKFDVWEDDNYIGISVDADDIINKKQGKKNISESTIFDNIDFI